MDKLDFSAIKLLCIGDVILDRYLYSETDRISPEAPVPVLRLRERRAMLGGVGNVARNIAALGGHAVVLGMLGQDAAAQEVEALLAATPGIEAALTRSPSRPTTTKVRVIAAHQQVVRIDEEVSTPAAPQEEDALCDAIDAWAPHCQGMILSDYAKGVLTERVAAHAIAAARRAGASVFVDPKIEDLRRFRGATCLKPNLRELALASRMPVESAEQVAAAAREVMRSTDVPAILVTRASKGMMLIEADGQVETVPARAQEVFDVSGAGDTAIAVAALAHAKGLGLGRATRLANAAASLVVGKLGTATVSPEELAHEIGLAPDDAMDDAPEHLSEDAVPDRRKHASLPRAMERVRIWQANGLRVGFTNGCFDVLHAGHVSLLRQARRRCDRLVVALNADASVARLKGPTRPVNGLADRATVVAALECVDLVVAFDEDTPLEAIRALLPDVLVKGADWRIEDVVGGDLVTARGGQVVLAALLPARSTTRTIARLASAAAAPTDP